MTRYLPDDFGKEVTYRNLHQQTYDKERGFYLTPGFYEGHFNSFCIRAGTYAPRKGNGRYYAPLKGPKADIVEAIVKGYQDNPAITQQEVQLLLWAIIAKTDFQEMKGDIKATALKLLDSKQILRLSKGTLERYATDELRKVAFKNESLRYIAQAENDLRNLYHQGVESYQDYEAIAIREGMEPLSEKYTADRWTRHPDGFFIRYKVQDFPYTITQVYVPEQNINNFSPITDHGPSPPESNPGQGGVYFMPRNAVAMPSDGSAQRILQTDVPHGDESWGENGGILTDGGAIGTSDDNSESSADTENQEDNTISCQEIVHPAIDAAIKEEMIMQDLPGIAVGVFKKGKLVHLKAYGYTDIIKKKEVTLNTVIRWASISKTVTAVAAFQLEDFSTKNNSGIGYSISDTITEHFNYWPKSVDYCSLEAYKDSCQTNERKVDTRFGDITIAQLLQNRGGLQHYGKGLRDSTTAVFDSLTLPFRHDKSLYKSDADGFNAKSAVDIFKNSILAFTPGASYNYSTYGFSLAAATIEAASPNGYVDWVLENIAKPANMDSFRAGNKRDHYGHEMREDGLFATTIAGSEERVLPGGGWESNICDLAKFAINLSGDAFYNVNTHPVGRIWEGAIGNGEYRHGIRRSFNPGPGNTSVWHTGDGKNSRTMMYFFPSDTTGVVFLGTSDYMDRSRMANRIMYAFGEHPSVFKNTPIRNTPVDNCNGPNKKKNGNDLFVGIWRKTDKDSSKTDSDQLIRTGRPHEEFFDQLLYLQAAGYYCTDIKPFIHNNKLYWDGVFKKGNVKVKIRRDHTKEGFINEIGDKLKEGYALVDLETYRNPDGKRRWAGLFRETSEEYAYLIDQDYSTLQNRIEELGQKGLYLIDIEAHFKGDKKRYSGIFKKRRKTWLGFANTLDDFETLIREQQSKGLKLMDQEVIENNPGGHSVDFIFYGIWEESVKDEIFEYKTKYCDFMDSHETESARGYLLLDMDRISFNVEEK
ncbi:serine hydrolase domain-containing protein [Lentiprolixibacter aurantiacus]|uniref:Serine hydrolase n=1 Tax=Lentiprolixibacter aurantiacus TaxID=2993939 RepID=A0AAE3MID8_9FLAO|nr:serine hydrolase domain-containing protein [Lentiprolixibacter aurantiacus]MCX2718091.1 serine hydrolase [Lentiprolixibacter aurantiacus]